MTDFLGIKSIQRSLLRLKTESTRALRLKTAQLYILVFGGNNAGDYFSNPALYFDFSPLRIVTVTWKELARANYSHHLREGRPILFGGGGVFEASRWREALISRLSEHHPLFSWGAGTNRPLQQNIERILNSDEANAPTMRLELFQRVGLRDFRSTSGQAYRGKVTFVPCASAMHPTFEIESPLARDAGLVKHASLSENFPYNIPEEIPSISMDLRRHSIDQIVGFIASSEVVFTTSYHAAYWASLFGRPAVVPEPISSKFCYLQQRPIYARQSLKTDLLRARAMETRPLLDESRKLNIQFFRTLALELALGNSQASTLDWD